MEDREVDVFEIDSDGRIVYESADPEESVNDSGNLFGVGGSEDGIDVTENVNEGDIVSDPLEGSEGIPETEENVSSDSESESIGSVAVLSDEVQLAVYNALSPASGSLGSSTIDYFDRIVSGLPRDYRYIAYRTSEDSSYDGVLYLGDNYTVSDNVITFGDGAQELRVYRVSSSSYNSTVRYSQSDASGASIAYDLDGDVVYYTNSEIGYPVLGGVVQSIGFDSLLVCGLLTACLTVVLQKLLLKR